MSGETVTPKWPTAVPSAAELLTLAYSGLTGTTYVLLRNGQKRAVPEAEVVAVIAAYLDDHHLTVTKPDGAKVRYGVLDES